MGCCKWRSKRQPRNTDLKFGRTSSFPQADTFESADVNSTRLGTTGVMKKAIPKIADIFHRGVSIKILRDLKKEWNLIRKKVVTKRSYSRPDATREASNGEKVVELIVKEKCGDVESSYVELLNNEIPYKDAIGECNVFISHAWQYDFGDLMSAIEDFERDNSNKEKFYYFLDFIAVNQFKPDADLKNLQNLVYRCKYFLLVLLPWQEPIPLTRMWCIYEIATALRCKKRPIVGMPRKEEELLKEELMRGENANAIVEVFKKLDSENAKVSFEADRKMIAEYINSNLGGFEKVDEEVGACLRSWVVGKLLKIHQDWPRENMKSKDRGNFLILAGRFLDFQGEYSSAVKMYKECIKLRRESKDDKSDAVLIAMNNLAVAYDNLGKHDMAMVIRKELVLVKEAVCGPNHPSTLELKDSLAVSYDHMNRHREALVLKRQVLRIREQLHGKEHNSVLNSKNNIAFSLRFLGNHDEVLSLNMEIYNIRRKKLGEWDPLTILAAFNLATSYTRLGQHKNALEKYREAYRGNAKIAGVDNDYTIQALCGIITSLKHLAEFKEAKKLAEQGRALVGPNHDRTKEFVEAIKYFNQMVDNQDVRSQRLVEIEAGAKSADSVTVKAILSYKPKILGEQPQERVYVPPGGMEVTEYLRLCDRDIEGNMQYYYVENGKREKLKRIPHQAATVWVKSTLSCNIIQTYLPKVRGKWPTVNVWLPKEGISKKDLISKIDKRFDAQLYKLENKCCEPIDVVMPGTSVLWMQRLRRNVKPRS